MAKHKIKQRLEYLRAKLQAERISQGEFIELQSLAAHIASGDTELREAAGVPEAKPLVDADPKTRVVFRVWRFGSGKGDVIALFPDEKADDDGHCMSYEHVGQHGGAAYVGVIARTRPAKPAEYGPLAEELAQRGYNLKISKRSSRRR